MKHADRRKSGFWKKTFSFIAVLCLTGVAGVAALLLYLRGQALPASTFAQPSVIYDIHGELIGSYYSGHASEYVPLDQISPYVVQATLAIEDQRFYSHFGLDLKGIARAALVNLEHMEKVQGASTLTQQLARNLYLSQDRTWSRKIKEAMYALQLEMQLTKDQILEKYLNEIYFGHSAYGVQAASHLFFGKDAKDLTLAESALLAGIPKGPRYYSPFYDMDNAKSRQELILDTMARLGYISAAEAERAKKEKLSFRTLENNEPQEAPYFRDYVRKTAVDLLGITERQFDDGGIRVYTTLDLKMQQIAEETIARQMPENGELQVALVAVDPRNGYIKAMVGGKNYSDNQFNRAVSGSRQPGSAFKPFVYLTALKSGKFTPVTRVKSEPTVFTYDDGKKTYAPSNFGNKYPNDYIDMREAIAKSDNIYAVHTILEVGAENVIDTAKKLGIRSPLQPLPSLALGAFPVSPLEMASAFGVIANQGVRVEPTAILRIESANGKVLYEAQPKQERVIEPEYTYVLTNLMQSVFAEGGTAARVAGQLKRPAAGKTGTTNTDAWFVGFTPELSTAVWIGYDRDRAISAAESYKAAPIFAEFTERSLAAIPPKIFPMPDRVTSVYIDPATGKIASEGCPNARLEVFVKGTEPTETCTGQAAQPDMNPPAEQKQHRSWWEQLKRWWTDD